MEFKSSPTLTLGAELELQLLDKTNLNLSSSSPEVLRLLAGNGNIKSELYQSMIEITTGICGNALDLGQQLGVAMDQLRSPCEELGLTLASGGMHPLAHYQDGVIFPDDRYRRILKEQRWLAQRLLIFGFHVHVGMRDGDHAIQMINSISQYLPLFLALSASSPFFNGKNTQLASCRSTFFESLPTGGHGYHFADWADFNKGFNSLNMSGAVLTTRDLWWDIRPSPDLGTIEIRICDAPATLSEAVAIAALIHVVCLKADHDLNLGKASVVPSPWLLRENKWRAARDGIDAEFICDEFGQTVPARRLLWNVIDECSDLVSANGYGPQVSLLKSIMLLGSSSCRQREVLETLHQDFKHVIRSLIQELETGEPMWTQLPPRRLTCA